MGIIASVWGGGRVPTQLQAHGSLSVSGGCPCRGIYYSNSAYEVSAGTETPGKGGTDQIREGRPEEMAQLMQCQDLMKSNASGTLWLLE